MLMAYARREGGQPREAGRAGLSSDRVRILLTLTHLRHRGFATIAESLPLSFERVTQLPGARRGLRAS